MLNPLVGTKSNLHFQNKMVQSSMNKSVRGPIRKQERPNYESKNIYVIENLLFFVTANTFLTQLTNNTRHGIHFWRN